MPSAGSVLAYPGTRPTCATRTEPPRSSTRLSLTPSPGQRHADSGSSSTARAGSYVTRSPVASRLGSDSQDASTTVAATGATSPSHCASVDTGTGSSPPSRPADPTRAPAANPTTAQPASSDAATAV